MRVKRASGVADIERAGSRARGIDKGEVTGEAAQTPVRLERSGGGDRRLAVIGAGLALTSAARAAVWTATGETRVFPATAAGTNQSITISAAGNEYVGRIIGLHSGAQHKVTVTWVDGSDPLLTANTVLDQVAFVHIRRVTTYSGAKPGLYPDPLLPRKFGQSLTAPAHSSSLYVLLHVPYGTTAGTYSGGLHVVYGSQTVTIPVSLRVWDFGWSRLSVRTGFVVDFPKVTNPIATYTMLEQHGVTPLMPKASPRVQSNGAINATAYADSLRPYLDADGLDMAIARMPWLSWCPSFSWKFSPGSSRLLAYLTNVCRVYKDNGWQSQLVAFPVDEPTSRSAELKAQALAVAVHRASARVGFRAKFLLTDDPRPTSLGPMLPANKELYNDVDIWCTRYYYFFGRVPVLRALQRKGKQVWWYPYYNSSVRALPNFVIEKSLADERVWGWLMEQWNVNGMLYWGVNRWGNARTGCGPSRPLPGPALVRATPTDVWPTAKRPHLSRLLPALRPERQERGPGVVAAPRGAARGFQDLEYCRIATGLIGATQVHDIVKGVTTYPYAIKYGHRFDFPKYSRSTSAYDRAHARLAQAIEAAKSAPATGGDSASSQATGGGIASSQSGS